MIYRTNRFTGHYSVSRVRGRSLQLDGVRIFYAANQKRDDFRMAVVVSKKIAKSAVVRNRIRRRLYEAVRTSALLHGLAVDVVFVVQDSAVAETDAVKLHKDIATALAAITRQIRS